MSEAFVWFHNESSDSQGSTAFYRELLDWKPIEGPGGLPFFGGSAGPFAEILEARDGLAGWVPYAQVDDVDEATQRAIALGAEVLRDRARGPAGDFTIIRDPGGAPLALWQKA